MIPPTTLITTAAPTPPPTAAAVFQEGPLDSISLKDCVGGREGAFDGVDTPVEGAKVTLKEESAIGLPEAI